MIGPNVIQAIIDNTGDNWKGFPFLFALCTAASLVIWFGTSFVSSPAHVGCQEGAGVLAAAMWLGGSAKKS